MLHRSEKQGLVKEIDLFFLTKATMPLDCKMIDQMAFFPVYCPSQKPVVSMHCKHL